MTTTSTNKLLHALCNQRFFAAKEHVLLPRKSMSVKLCCGIRKIFRVQASRSLSLNEKHFVFNVSRLEETKRTRPNYSVECSRTGFLRVSAAFHVTLCDFVAAIAQQA